MELNIVEKQKERSSISIVIPIYNRENMITRTLDSLLKQTYRPLEIVLVDNNSIDNSLDVCNSFKEKYEADDFRILIEVENKEGANAARNKGLSLATGYYISFYDSDDEMASDRIACIMNAFEQYDPDIIAFPVIFQNETMESTFKVVRRKVSVTNQILTSTLATQNFVAKTSFIREIGGWNEELFRWQDWELGVRIMLKHPNIYWIYGKPLDIIHVHSSSITGSSFASSFDSLLKTLHTVRDVIEQSNNVEKKKALEALFFRQMQLSAHLKHENAIAQGELCYNDLSNIPCCVWKKIYFKLLFKYIEKGGRGAWRFVYPFL